MSAVVIGVGASHTTLMNTKWDEVDHLERAHTYRDALADAREAIARAGTDTVVVIGSNHFRGFWLDLMPAFTIGVGEVIAAGEHGTPSGLQPSDPAYAHRLLDSMFADIDLAFSASLSVDHGITHAIQYLVPEELPVIPLIVNCFAPPLPSVARCARLGTSLADAIASDGEDRRVAVIGSGGLSHHLPFPDWREPESDDDHFLVESWLRGRGRWADFETRRRSIVVTAEPRLDESFDHSFLAATERGSLPELIDRISDPGRLAGNGANEIRNWIAMAAACRWAPGSTLAYSPMPEWLTGMGVATITPDRPTDTTRSHR